LLQKVQGLDEVKGYCIFLNRTTNQLPWQQNEVLTAELYGDLLVENGDLNDFIKWECAAVVGILIAAFYNPIWTSSIFSFYRLCFCCHLIQYACTKN
jgi:hypothetical protein